MTPDLRVLIDTNVFLSYLLRTAAKEDPIGRMVDAALAGEFTLLMPAELLSEIRHTLTSKPYFAQRLAPADTQPFLDALLLLGQSIDLVEGDIPAIVRDPRDDYLIAAAFIGDADYLVTGDQDLLALASQLEPLKIVRPAVFVREVLGRE